MIDTGPLGVKTPYIQTYTPELLFPVSRQQARGPLGIECPFKGCDIWTGYELSWLNAKGKPEITIAQFIFPCANPFLIESKSFKLYLNSFNQSKFDSHEEVRLILERDLSRAAGGDVRIVFLKTLIPSEIEGICLDDLDVETDVYEMRPEFLRVGECTVEETVVSHLLKSNCLATGQPDWGTVVIDYQGKQIDHEGLLKYIISYRNHSGFAEHCAEQMFMDLMKICQPEKLSLQILYTRRGGLDINPFRSTWQLTPETRRLCRQ